MFSCEFCEIYNNTFFTEHLWTSAFVFLGHEESEYSKTTCTDIKNFFHEVLYIAGYLSAAFYNYLILVDLSLQAIDL